MNELTLTYNLPDMDIEKVYYAIQQEYWGSTLSNEDLNTAFSSSFCVGAKLNGEQIGFARAVSDTITCSYIRDMVIFESFRRQGYGRQLLSGLLNHPELKDVASWFLGTKNAHAFYLDFGFKKSPNGIYMFLHRE